MTAIESTTVERIQFLADEEGRQLFDTSARRTMGTSGEEFIRRRHAGECAEIADDADHPEIMRLAMLIPFAREDAGRGH